MERPFCCCAVTSSASVGYSCKQNAEDDQYSDFSYGVWRDSATCSPSTDSDYSGQTTSDMPCSVSISSEEGCESTPSCVWISDQSSAAYAILGGIVGVLVVMTIITCVVCCVRKRRANRQQQREGATAQGGPRRTQQGPPAANANVTPLQQEALAQIRRLLQLPQPLAWETVENLATALATYSAGMTDVESMRDPMIQRTVEILHETANRYLSRPHEDPEENKRRMDMLWHTIEVSTPAVAYAAPATERVAFEGGQAIHVYADARVVQDSGNLSPATVVSTAEDLPVSPSTVVSSADEGLRTVAVRVEVVDPGEDTAGGEAAPEGLPQATLVDQPEPATAQPSQDAGQVEAQASSTVEPAIPSAVEDEGQAGSNQQP